MHLAELGAPLLGDLPYGGRIVSPNRLIPRVALHARVLGFRHPDGRLLSFEVEPPADFASAVEALRRGSTWRA